MAFANTNAQITVHSEQTYDSGALYGYMNGGSELYLEYGFKRLTVKELTVNNQKLTLEHFEMASPLSAYGIYSINIFKCLPCDLVKHWPICGNDYQLQAVVNNSYISIINTNGSTEAQEAAQFLLNKELKKHPIETQAYYPGYIEKLRAEKTMYINGPLAIQNRSTDWLDIYKDLKLQKCYILSWPTKRLSILVIPNIPERIDRLSKEEFNLKTQQDVVFVAPKGKDDAFVEQLFKQL
jgi:hypothetical protein